MAAVLVLSLLMLPGGSAKLKRDSTASAGGPLHTARSRVSAYASAADDGPLADLSVAKSSSPDTATADADLTYTIQVANVGPYSADSATLDDTIPAGTTFVNPTQVGTDTTDTNEEK
jgi:uncharacterized repeat protein (TIGR01451 family)